MYAEVGPQVRCAAVMPPSNDDSVPYTLLLHDQNRAKDPEGMSTYTMQHSSTSSSYG